MNAPGIGYNRNTIGKAFDLAIKQRIGKDVNMNEMTGNRRNVS